MICPKCGRQWSDGQDFCGNCGSALTLDAVAPVPASANFSPDKPKRRLKTGALILSATFLALVSAAVFLYSTKVHVWPARRATTNGSGVTPGPVNSSLARGTVYRSIQPQTFASILREQGVTPELKKGSGREFIALSVEGWKCGVVFYDCKDSDCKTFQYTVGWRFGPDERVSLDLINEWNRAGRFGKAYLDKDGDPMLEMDVEVSGGVTSEYLYETFTTFRSRLISFRRALTNKKIE